MKLFNNSLASTNHYSYTNTVNAVINYQPDATTSNWDVGSNHCYRSKSINNCHSAVFNIRRFNNKNYWRWGTYRIYSYHPTNSTTPNWKLWRTGLWKLCRKRSTLPRQRPTLLLAMFRSKIYKKTVPTRTLVWLSKSNLCLLWWMDQCLWYWSPTKAYVSSRNHWAST